MEIERLSYQLKDHKTIIEHLENNLNQQKILIEDCLLQLSKQIDITSNISLAVESEKVSDVFSWLATRGKKREWINPHLDNIISITASSTVSLVDISTLVNKETRTKNYLEKPPFTTKDEQNSWILFDFRCYVFKPKTCYIRSSTMVNWSVQGSNDNVNWETLKEVKQDINSIEKKVGLIASRKYYRFIKVLQNGPNRDNKHAFSVYHCTFSGNILIKESLFL
jgi:hypothetical protein